MKRHACNWILLFTLSGFSFAAGTRTWDQSKLEDLLKGTSQGVALTSDGNIELAPAFKTVITISSPYIWSIVSDKAGNLYVATGTPARVYQISPDGKSEEIFQSQELQVQALAVDKNGAVYAATNPDGKVYKLELGGTINGAKKSRKQDRKPVAADSNWKFSVFFEPGTKYIWDMVFDGKGNLYVATGDRGEIFQVAPGGEHDVFFKSDEAQIRALTFDAQQNLIAGSDGSGLIYRISQSGDGFVLFSAPKKEITALAIDHSGNIYAAAAGDKKSSSASFSNLTISPLPSSSPPPGAAPNMSLSMSSLAASQNPASPSLGIPGSNVAGGSEVYRISTDGAPARVWNSSEDLVYALAFDANGELLAGTGNRGHIFQIGYNDKFADLLKASASQVTAFAHASSGLYASSSNLGKVFLLGASPSEEGSYTSDVFDAGIFSQWGRAEFRGRGNVELFVRSGNVDNPDRNWSPWQKVELQKDARLGVPPSRFIQWKAVLHAGNPSPRVEKVIVNYLSKNVAPVFEEVAIQPGVRYPPSAKSTSDSGRTSSSGSQRGDSSPSSTQDHDSISVKWTVHDDNDDDMVYSIFYRGEGDSRWLQLKNNLTEKFFSFDSSLLPDGAYTIKVVASDAPSHSPGQALTAERESQRFEMDTTPPRIEDLHGVLSGGQVHVTFRATDTFSPIQKAEYSMDAGDWQLVEPIGQISDAKTENYDFQIDLMHAGSASVSNLEHVVVVRAYDRHDNLATAKTVVRGK